MFQKLESFFDKKADSEIISILSDFDTCKITPDNVHLILKLALRVIIYDTSRTSVTFCWNILKAIQSLPQKLPLENLISKQVVYDILDDEKFYECQEVLEVINWILSNTDSEEIKMAVKEKIIEVVGRQNGEVPKTLQNLNSVLQAIDVMRNHPQMIAQKEALVAMCIQLVQNISTFQMPNESTDILVFMNSFEKIKEFLSMILVNPPKELQISLLQTVYMCISDPRRVAGPGLAVVLQSINADFIMNAVRYILVRDEDDASLARALNVLCGWLFQWTRSPNLGNFVIAFMKGLEVSQKYAVLHQVTLERIKQMCMMLKFPVYRTSVSSVLFYMLASMQHDPAAFLIAVEQFPSVILILKQENSDSSRICLQKIVDISTALMEHFPGNESFYGPLRVAMKDFQPSLDYKSTLNVPVWADKLDICISRPNVPEKVGLHNLGNTCYMNSVLQALFMTQAFRNEILISQCSVLPIVGLQNLFTLLQFSKRDSISPEKILQIRPPGFVPGLQNDSSEFMEYLLDLLHEQEKSKITAQYCNDGAECGPPKTIVQRIFGGQSETSYRCDSCSRESTKSDPFRDLQLSFPIAVSGENSVQSLLEYLLEPEQLCGENQYWCDHCATHTDAERVFRILQPSDHLILTLKHFRYDPQSHIRAKLFKRVSYNTVIQLNSCRYELYAAVVHSGPSVDSGHYYTFAKDELGVWYEFNDSRVIRSSLSELSDLQQLCTPYILFYKQHNVKLSPPLTLEALSLHLQSVVRRDLAAFNAEKRQITPRTASIILRRPEDDDPPSSCGDGDFNAGNTSRIIF